MNSNLKTNNKKRRIALWRYVAFDFVSSMISWALFYALYKTYEGFSIASILKHQLFFVGCIFIPLMWILFYGLFEEYGDIYRKSRVTTFIRTFFYTFIGALLLFFFLTWCDIVSSHEVSYSRSFFIFFGLQSMLVLVSRMILLLRAKSDVKRGIVSFRTLIIGDTNRSLDCYLDITRRSEHLGYDFVGYLDFEENTSRLGGHIQYLGDPNDIEHIVDKQQIEEVIVAVENIENSQVRNILSRLFALGSNVLIKIIPELYDILLGYVKMSHLYGAVLIEVEREMMPRWQRLLKRVFDIVVSTGVLIVLSPLYLFVAIQVMLSSPGPIIYRQQRVGAGGKEFWIYKFRSMHVDAEPQGPRLSSEGDERVTPWGELMRKYRLDELPQFWNVLKGDMSVVGPRPERKYYVDQIVKLAPHYNQLLKVRPGITSWGMVKYGYASSLEEMVQRLKFDLLYIENRSLALDFKILFYTILVIIKGDGK